MFCEFIRTWFLHNLKRRSQVLVFLAGLLVQTGPGTPNASRRIEPCLGSGNKQKQKVPWSWWKETQFDYVWLQWTWLLFTWPCWLPDKLRITTLHSASSLEGMHTNTSNGNMLLIVIIRSRWCWGWNCWRRGRLCSLIRHQSCLPLTTFINLNFSHREGHCLPMPTTTDTRLYNRNSNQ